MWGNIKPFLFGFGALIKNKNVFLLSLGDLVEKPKSTFPQPRLPCVKGAVSEAD